MNQARPNLLAAPTTRFLFTGWTAAALLCLAVDSPARGGSHLSTLRFAHSPDGLTFRDTGVVFAERASSPELFRMPGGTLLALFDHAANASAPADASLHVAFSHDDGKTWSPPRPADITDRAGRRLRATQGDMIMAPDGTLRLFFIEPLADRPAPRARSADLGPALRCAVTRNGLHFRLDDRFHPPSGLCAPSQPTAAVIDNRVQLLALSAPDAAARDRNLLLAISRDARQFARLASPDWPRDHVPGNIIEVDRKLRHYYFAPDGIRSAASADGRRWETDEAVRFPDAADPAVIRLLDRSFLMLYRPVPRSSTATSTAGLASSTREDAELAADADGEYANITTLDPAAAGAPMAPDPLAANPSPEPSLSNANADAPPTAEGASALLDAPADEAGAAQLADAAQPANADTELADNDSALSSFPDPDGFAPPPDFANPLNYMDWYYRFAASPLGHAASDAYAELIPLDDSLDGRGTTWPEDVKNLFADPDYDGPPFPWNPADHPEWESSRSAMKDLVDRFRAAAELDGYTTPSVTGDNSNLLLGIMLPALAPHRNLIKATLAEAWRTEDGRVSPERMQGAIRTSLRAADHMNEGSTLIEELVGLAERRLARATARAALDQKVFDSPDQLAATLETLREHDRPLAEPARTLRGEHAMAMDLIQHLYTPADAQGQPRFNPDRVSLLADLDGTPDDYDAFASLSPADIRNEIETLNRYYRELSEVMSIGYPAARAADLDVLQESVVDTGPLTRSILPALSRVHTLRARAEADRRATQLAYATQLFRARQGRWPSSLSELPADLAGEARIDPFTGRDFGYRVDESGPRIYSLSENARDDGGVHSPRWNDRPESPDAADDYVFWPPQEK